MIPHLRAWVRGHRIFVAYTLLAIALGAGVYQSQRTNERLDAGQERLCEVQKANRAALVAGAGETAQALVDTFLQIAHERGDTPAQIEQLTAQGATYVQIARARAERRFPVVHC